MIHPTEMPEFGSKRNGKNTNTKPPEHRMTTGFLGDDLQSHSAECVERRHSWTTTISITSNGSDSSLDDHPHPPSWPKAGSELANALWGRTLQAMKERILPTGTAREALEILADSASKTEGQGSPSHPIVRRSLSPSFQSMLKLKSARFSNESTSLICACIRRPKPQQSGNIDENKATARRRTGEVLLLRRDEAYDLVLVFDRAFNPEVDRVDLVLELEDQLLSIPGINVITIPISTSPPGPLTKKDGRKSWWAGFIDFREVATIRFHVSHTAHIGKWRINVVTRNKQTGKGPANKCLAFERVHIAMNPGQINGRKAFIKSFNRPAMPGWKET